MTPSEDFERMRSYFILVWALTCNLCLVNCRRSDKMYVIAHMCNNAETAKWALEAGANAIEMDLQFDKRTGQPTDFHHGSPCDCTCHLLFSNTGNICQFSGVCSARTPHAKQLDLVRKYPKLALIYLDSKNAELSSRVQTLAGKNIVNVVEREIFQKGFGGKVLIGAGNSEVYITAVAKAVSSSQWKDRIYVSLDTSNNAASAIPFMVNLPTRNIIFAAGESACSPRGFKKEICLGGVNRDRGVLSNVIAWTVDKESSFESYFNHGARGIITNRVPDLIRWIKSKNLKLAAPLDDSLPPRSSNKIISGGESGCFNDDSCKGKSCAFGSSYPCNQVTNFSYGCKRSYCWSQCSATLVAKEWCHTVYKSNNQWMRCSKHSDCKEASECGNSKCSGGCSV